jgi:chaperonin GroES
MANSISDLDMLRASRKANRGVLDEPTIGGYMESMEEGTADMAGSASPEAMPDDSMSDFAQQSFSRRGIASSGIEGEATEDGFDGSTEDMGEEDFEDTDADDLEADRLAGEEARAYTASLSPIDKLIHWADPINTPNIALELDAGKLTEIAFRVVEEAAIDEKSRADWLEVAEKGMEMALQRAVAKSYPWLSASNVIFPLITEAADQFAARAYPAIIQDRKVVKGVVIGDDKGGDPNAAAMPGAGGAMPIGGLMGSTALSTPKAGDKAARAKRIGDHMSYQHLEEMPEWEEDTDKLLNILPVVGCEFRKTYRDIAMGRNVSVRVGAKNVIINYWAKSTETAPRITEVIKLYPHEIQEHINSGFFLDHQYGPAADEGQDKDHPHTFYEQHRRLDLDDDGYTEPYIVTVHKDSSKVARIVARWDANGGLKRVPGENRVARIDPVHYYTKYDFLPNKEGGIYGHGFAHNLKTMNEAINSTLNMLLDAGHLQNTGGGFVGKGLGMMSGAVKFTPGEWKVVNAAGQDIRNAIVPLVHPGPSTVLFSLLGTLIEAGKDISSVKDVLTGEVRAQTMSPTVFMALVEQGLKVFTAIYKRVHRSLKAEYRKVYRLNRIYMADQEQYQSGEEWLTISREDYISGAAVVPVSDPTMVVDAQKMARTDVLMQFKDDPLMNGKAIRQRALEAAGIENAEELLEVDPAPNPDLAIKTAQLALQTISAKADVLVKISQAIKNMAEADAKVMEPFQQWAQIQLAQVKNEYDHIANQTEAGADQPEGAAQGQGIDPGLMGAMAPPPGNEGAAPIPGGLPGAAAA